MEKVIRALVLPALHLPRFICRLCQLGRQASFIRRLCRLGLLSNTLGSFNVCFETQ